MIPSEELNAFIDQLASSYGVDADLVHAIIQIESGWNEWAVRFEPNYKWLDAPVEWALKLGTTPETETILQKTSWGLMQVMGGVARQHGYKRPLTMLLLPKDGLEVGIQHLQSKVRVYGAVEKNVIASYNSGSPIINNGVYKNQKYIDLVSARLRDIRLTKKGK